MNYQLAVVLLIFDCLMISIKMLSAILLSVLIYFCSSVAAISNGVPTRPEDVPWTAAIIRDDGRYCAGALISEQHVITSAFCLDKQIQIEVILGGYEIKNSSDHHLSFVSREVFVHEEWNPVTLQNDMGIVKLPKPITFTNKIAPIRLASSFDDRWNGYILNITGWGETKNSFNYSTVLRTGLAEGQPASVCEDIYPNHFNKSVHFCFGGEWNSTMCAGDEGGPVSYYYGGAAGLQLVGIASFRMAQSCATANGSSYPGVYTSVWMYLDWIQKYVPM